MTWGMIFLILSAIIFLALGFDIVQDTGKIHLRDVGWGFIPLGILTHGYSIPVNFTRS